MRINIGKLSKAVGVSVHTIRYYESLELLLPEERSQTGYRVYSQDSIYRLKFIGKAQRLGFSLEEIKGLLNLRISDSGKCGDVKEHVEKKIALIEAKERELHEMKRELKNLEATCISKNHAAIDCPIIEKLYPTNIIKEAVND